MTTVIEQFLQNAQEHPDKTALIFEQKAYTYQALCDAVISLSKLMTDRGVQTDDMVSICMSRSAEMVISLLATMYAGATYIPVDPKQPASRLDMIFEDVEPKLILSDKETSKRLNLQQDVLFVDELNLSTMDVSREPAPQQAAQLAYIIFTSGSTGRPKGVEVYQSSLSVFLEAMAEQPGIRSDDVLLAVTTIAFDIAALELYLPLTRGATLVLMDSQSAMNAPVMQATLDKYNVSILQATPATYQLLLDSDWIGGQQLKLLCGGEALSLTLAQRLLPQCHELWNMYGPTETTIWSSLKKISASDQKITIGKPIKGTSFLILDETGQDKPEGEVGELCIAGKGLSRGYHKRPDLTEKAFIERSIDGQMQRIYRTGDLAKMLDNGDYECLGRTDNQVKIRGFRIELGEIESVLVQMEVIKQVAVNVYTDDRMRKYLIAYVVSDEDEVKIEMIRDYLASKLPAYMIPTSVINLDALPLTPNNKVDRKSLPTPSFEATEGEIVAPENARESEVVELYKKILGLQHVSTTDNFVDLGGDSLTFVRATMELEKVLGTVPDEWEKTSIIELARGESTAAPSIFKWIDTEIFLRAIAIVAVVFNVLGYTPYYGDSDVLFLAAGFSFATYQLNSSIHKNSVTPIVNTLSRVALPTLLMVILVQVLKGELNLGYLLFMGNFYPPMENTASSFWFLFVYIQILIILLAVLWVPKIRQLAKGRLFFFSNILLLASVVMSAFVISIWDTDYLYNRVPQFWISQFLIGTCIALARTLPMKLFALASLIMVALLMDEPDTVRFYSLLIGGLLLLTTSRLPLIPVVDRVIFLIGGASLFIYLTFSLTNSILIRIISEPNQYLVVFICLVVGVIAWKVWDFLNDQLNDWRQE